MPQDVQKTAEALFGALGQGESLYALLDSARNAEIALRLRGSNMEHDSLYRGRSEEALWDVAPYLVRCERAAEFFTWVLEKGWGNSWGIFLTSSANLEELCKHFRQFLLVTLEDDKEVYFRFYDPRVLRVFLPTCSTEQMDEFFGPVRSYLTEAEQPGMLLRFVVNRQEIQQATTTLTN
jgi:hypothetical protein